MIPPAEGGARPTCQECGCTTGGAAFCYRHVPYMVYPQNDGTFIVDRNGRKRVWFEEPPSPATEAAETQDAAPAPLPALDITQALIELWSQDTSLAVGIPYRRMASEAAEVVARLTARPAQEREP
jgi:hypothetical protein